MYWYQALISWHSIYIVGEYVKIEGLSLCCEISPDEKMANDFLHNIPPPLSLSQVYKEQTCIRAFRNTAFGEIHISLWSSSHWQLVRRDREEQRKSASGARHRTTQRNNEKEIGDRCEGRNEGMRKDLENRESQWQILAGIYKESLKT